MSFPSKLGGTCLFMATFLLVIFLQRDIGQTFKMEDALLRKLQGSLPQDSSGYFNSDSSGASQCVWTHRSHPEAISFP
jgi:hypothetical protein